MRRTAGRRAADSHAASMEFDDAIVATIRAHRMLSETDLAHSLRGSMGWSKPVGVADHWSFGDADYRMRLDRLVREGRLALALGGRRGGGMHHTYSLGDREVARA